MFFNLVKNNLQAFLFSLDILVKMSTYVSPICYYFIMITWAMSQTWVLVRKCMRISKSGGNVIVAGSLSTAAAGNHVKGEPSVCALQEAHTFFCT